MINLIPPQARKSIILEYWLRVVSVWAILFTVVGLIVGTLLLPSYTLLRSQFETLEEQTASLSAEDKTLSEAEAIIRDTNAFASELQKGNPNLNLGTLINAVNEAAVDGITFRTYSVERAGTEVHEIKIQGVASSRSSLAALKTALEENALFETAAVPISDLVRDIDLPFAITVTLSEPSNE